MATLTNTHMNPSHCTIFAISLVPSFFHSLSPHFLHRPTTKGGTKGDVKRGEGRDAGQPRGSRAKREGRPAIDMPIHLTSYGSLFDPHIILILSPHSPSGKLEHCFLPSHVQTTEHLNKAVPRLWIAAGKLRQMW